ncbi:hypothetical protein [Collimonas humicola]|uniref:hypothetical protein n=1 Tax=Collimonas humicola TaxID=2825886 RepID=UPI001B8C157B|nr:hypothetical protein [Collimonas humicola]
MIYLLRFFALRMMDRKKAGSDQTRQRQGKASGRRRPLAGLLFLLMAAYTIACLFTCLLI